MAEEKASTFQRRQKRAGQRGSLATSFILALWRLRQTWRQLLMTGLALLAACTVACIPALFSAVADTAGLQQLFNSSPARTTLALNVSAGSISSATVGATLQRFEKIIRPGMGAYLASTAAEQVIMASKLTITQPESLNHTAPFHLYATSIQRLRPALHLIQGRWANEQMTNGELEIMLNAVTAQALGLSVGTTLTVQSGFVTDHFTSVNNPKAVMHMRLVGIFANSATDVPALHGETFQPVEDYTGTTYTFLLSDTAFLQACDQIAAREGSPTVSASQIESMFHMAWYYQLHVDQLQFGQTDILTTRLATVQSKVISLPANTSHTFPYIANAQFLNPPVNNADISSLLSQYNSRVTVIHLPVSLLSLQIIALLLFFACLLMNQLIDRQMTMSAQLSSRGASSRQLLWSLLAQALSLCVLALVLGPLLGTLAVYQLTQRIVPVNEQAALTGLFSSPGQIFSLLAPYLGGTFLVALLAVGLPCRRSSYVNILELRRETARASKQPFWLRYYLDLGAALLALSGFGVALYLAQVAHTLDLKTQELVITPLILVTPLFLLLGILLLFLRVFPLLLRCAAHFARPARGATSLLALVQMVRSPFQATRFILLLALATTFASFALIFSASQNQRAVDIAAYESEADFSGNLPEIPDEQTLQDLMLRYSQIPGVHAASAGFVTTGIGIGLGATQASMEVQAVDTHSFTDAAIWETQYSAQPLSSLMNILRQHAPSSTSTTIVVPAIVDETTLYNLHLAPGYIFDISSDYPTIGNATLSFQVIDVVQHIPGVNGSAGITDAFSSGGLLVDFEALRQVYLNYQTQVVGFPVQAAQPLMPNYLWLRTSDTPGQLASVRTALNASDLTLSNLFDRRAISADLQSDPLVFSMLLIFSIGGTTALVLALLGNLLAAWLNVRLRLNSFVVLRALGASRWQVVSILLWEQGIVYLAALLLSIVLDALLVWLVVPQLIFTGLPSRGVLSEFSTAQFYLLQRVLPPQIVFPASLQLAIPAVIITCALALLLMARVVLNASYGQELRLNED